MEDNIENAEGFNPEKDTVIMVGVKSEDDFYAAWKQIGEETEQRIADGGEDQRIQAGAIFTHAGTEGLYLTPGKTSEGTIDLDEINGLDVLPWMDNGLLQLKGCQTGVEVHGKSVTGTFAKAQNISAFGQSGFANFSFDPYTYQPIGKNSNQVYLQAFESGKNAPLWKNILQQVGIISKKGSWSMDEITYNPQGGSINYSPLIPINGATDVWSWLDNMNYQPMTIPGVG